MAKPRKPRTPEQAASFLHRAIQKELKTDAYVGTTRDYGEGPAFDVEVSFPDESDQDRETIELFEDSLLPRLLKKELLGFEVADVAVGSGSVEFYLHPNGGA